MLDRLALGHLQALHDGLEAVTGKDAQQGIIEREEEARGTRIALATGTAAQLVVDAARLMPLRTDDVQAARRHHLVVQLLPLGTDFGHARIDLGGAQRLVVANLGDLLLDAAAEDDVGTPAGHVGGDRDDARTAGVTDDFCFARVLLGVEHLVRQLLVVEQRRQQFRVLDRGRADQHRLATFAAGADVGDDRLVLFLGGTEDLIVVVGPPHLLVGRDDHRLETIDLLELVGFGVGRAGHPGQLVVHTEVVLEGDRGQRLVLVLNPHSLLGFDGLMQTVGPAAAGHQATGEFVDDDHFAVLHHVLLVPQKEIVGAQGGVQVVDHQDVAGIVQTAAVG